MKKFFAATAFIVVLFSAAIAQTPTPVTVEHTTGPFTSAFTMAQQQKDPAQIVLPAVSGHGYIIKTISAYSRFDMTLNVSIGGVVFMTIGTDVSEGVREITFTNLELNTAKNTAVTIKAESGSGNCWLTITGQKWY